MTRKQKILTIAFALFLTLSVITVTYAFFTAGGDAQISSSVDITTGTLTLRLDDSDGYEGKVELNTIDPQNLTFTRRFEILNTGTVDAYAKVYWHDLVNSYLPGSLKYTLEESSNGTNFTAIITDRNVPRNAGVAKDAKLSNDLLIPTGNTPKYYKLTIRYDYSQTKDQSQDLSASFISGFTIVNGNEMSSLENQTVALGKVNPEDIPANHLRSQPYTINSSGNPERTKNNILGKTTYKDGSTIAETDFASITAVTTNVVPTDAIESWDVTASGGDSGSVMAWYTACSNRPEDWSATNCYDLYIGQDSGVIAPNDSATLFMNFINAKTIDLSYLITNYVTNMSYMIASNKGASAPMSVTNINISTWNTSNVNNMAYLFSYCASLTTLDVSNFDTSSVTNMRDMFQYCKELLLVDSSNFDTSKVTNMAYMFNLCYKLVTIDVSNWDTSNVTNMQQLFNRCYKVAELNVSDWDTSKVTNMIQIFTSCQTITELDVSNFDTSNVTNMRWMFGDCSSLTALDVSNFDTSNVTNMQAMFSNCMLLTNLNLSRLDFSKLTTSTSVQYMFYNCTALTELTTPAVMSPLSIDFATTLKDSNGNSYSALTSTTPTKTLLKSSWT